MKMHKSVLLPLDTSKISLSALTLAKTIASFLDMTIKILYVSDEEIPTKELMLKLNLNRDDISRFSVIHKKGKPDEVIVEEAENSNYVVMCTHGETGDMAKFSGSVTASVIQNTYKPVLLVRPDIQLEIRNDVWKPDKILIPMNGTPKTSEALHKIMELLIATDADLDLLHISPSKPTHTPESGEMTLSYYEDYQQLEWPSWSDEFLKRFCTELQNNETINFNFSYAYGDPGDEILNFADKNKDDLIVIAWHGDLGPIHAQILKKIMYGAQCPLFLVKISN